MNMEEEAKDLLLSNKLVKISDFDKLRSINAAYTRLGELHNQHAHLTSCENELA